MQCRINLSEEVSKLFAQGTNTCPRETILPRRREEMEILIPKPPGAPVVCGDCKYSGLWREALAQVRLWKCPLEQNHSPGRMRRSDVVKHPEGIPQLGDLWRLTHQNHFNSIYSAGERESKTDEKIQG